MFFVFLEDEPGDGRPKGLDSEDLEADVPANSDTTVSGLSEKSNITHIRSPIELKTIRMAFSSSKMAPTRSVSRESSTTSRSLRGNDYTTASIWSSLLQILKRGSFTIMFSTVVSGSVKKKNPLSNQEQNFIQRWYGEIFKELSLINCKSLIKQCLLCSMKSTSDRKSLIFIQQRDYLHYIHCSSCYPHLR